MITPSGTGSYAPSFDTGEASVAHKPTRTGSPGATSAVGRCVSERMQERPASFTPVTIRRTFLLIVFLRRAQPRERLGIAIQDLRGDVLVGHTRVREARESGFDPGRRP